jgi:hypothetical protein
MKKISTMAIEGIQIFEDSEQVGAPTVSRTSNLQRARIAHHRLRIEGWRQRRLGEKVRTTDRKRKNCLDSDRPSHGRS